MRRVARYYACGRRVKGRGTEPTFVAASGKARYEQVMAFIDTCHDAGVASPAIVLDELEH